jgi:hypothetical protein
MPCPLSDADIDNTNVLFPIGITGIIFWNLNRRSEPMTLFWKITIGAILALLVAAFVGLSFMAGSPKDAYGMVRYALPHMHRGNLKVGDDAPDAKLVALDGSDHFHIRERTGQKPLVLVFGSFT